MALLVGMHYLPGGNDDPNPPLGASTFLDISPSKGMQSPERMCRIYAKGKPEPALFAQQVRVWHQQGNRCQALNEPNLAHEGFTGGPNEYAAWFASVRAQAPAARLYWAGMSPGVSGWPAWYQGAEGSGAAGVCVHAYGTFDQMKATTEAVLAICPTLPLWLGEVNFGAGQVVDRDQWAVDHLKPFLDWCSTQPRIETVCHFAYRWPDPDMHLPTPVDAAGTRIETVIRTWQPPTSPEVPAMHKRAYLWQFDQLGETSVAEIAATLRLGGVAAVACKTHQELTWLGNATDGDTSPLAFRSLEDVVLRYEEFRAEGIAMVPWCVPMGTHVDQEAQRAADVAAACGGVVELDVEPYAGFWEGPKNRLEPYCQAITAAGVLYELNMDVRPGGIDPFGIAQLRRVADLADTFWTQSYWTTFQRPPARVIEEALDALDRLEVPTNRRGIIFPWDGPDAYAAAAAQVAAAGADTIGMWRMGTAGPAVYAALAAIPTTQPEPAPVPVPGFDVEAVRERLWSEATALEQNGWPWFATGVKAAVAQSKGDR